MLMEIGVLGKRALLTWSEMKIVPGCLTNLRRFRVSLPLREVDRVRTRMITEPWSH